MTWFGQDCGRSLRICIFIFLVQQLAGPKVYWHRKTQQERKKELGKVKRYLWAVCKISKAWAGWAPDRHPNPNANFSTTGRHTHKNWFKLCRLSKDTSHPKRQIRVFFLGQLYQRPPDTQGERDPCWDALPRLNGLGVRKSLWKSQLSPGLPEIQLEDSRGEPAVGN